jgi:DNA-directed RNA polymerase specialized sigma24 family protein
MHAAALPESLQTLAAHLPFGLDESARVGAAFERWRTATGGDHQAGKREKRLVDLWTYCFVRRYFLAKFAAQPDLPAVDLDAQVERVYQKVEAAREGVRDPQRYPHWVSVVCRNTFLNYVRRTRPATVSLDDEDCRPLPAGETVRGDFGLAHEVVATAIERLPDYLQPVARMRFLEERSYEAIHEETGVAIPTARTYAGRARKRLRDDPAVRALLDGPDG